MTLLWILAAASTPVFSPAQDPEVVVTGSRVASPVDQRLFWGATERRAISKELSLTS
jgi:hypothetical protein